ncbi:hypothetical protein BCAH1134_C0118 (plasmid) [Bacillus cereus AH1134]|nr:hypothetical protein BCAH1134_C0118 [Bacillus cereus AH1134]
MLLYSVLHRIKDKIVLLYYVGIESLKKRYSFCLIFRIIKM